MRYLVAMSLFALMGSTSDCSSPATPDAMPAADAPPPPAVTFELKDLPLNINRDLDLLFLIDDSPSMSDKQANLAANFPRFLDALATLPGGLPSVHIGVVTSDLGTKGAADATPGPGIGTLGQGGCAGFGKAGNLQLFGAQVSGGPFVSDIAQADGSRQKNYVGALSDVFATMAKAGAVGCGFEQPLEAIKQALSPSNALNQGFLRPNALLAVVVLTDEDDCSLAHSALLAAGDAGPLGPLQSFRCTRFGVLCDDGGATPDAMNSVGEKHGCHPAEGSQFLTGVAAYADFLKGLKASPGSVVVASVAGTNGLFAVELRAPGGETTVTPALTHSCTYVGADGKSEVADPPIRIDALLDHFPNHSASASICQSDLSGGLQSIVVPLRNAMLGSPCIDGTLADTDPATPGAQHTCVVAAVVPSQVDTPLPRCTPDDATATNLPCWRLATDPATCVRGDHVLIKIEGAGMLPASAHVTANCTILVEG